MFWTVIGQFICALVACGLLALIFDMDEETPWYIRWGSVVTCGVFAVVAGVSYKQPEIYTQAAAISFTGLGVMILGIVVYLIYTNRVNPNAIKVAFSALGVVALLWLAGSCSDVRRQKMQIEKAKGDTLALALDV